MFGSSRLRATALVACTVLAAAPPAAAQKGGRGAPPSGAEIAQQAKGKKLDEGNRLVAQFQGQPIVYTPATDNAVSSLDELRGGRFLGVLDTKATGDESGLPPGTYNVFVAEVDGRWRAFAEANGEIVKEAARVRLVRAEKGSRKPGFGEKGWYISDPLCCVDADGSVENANTIALTPAPASVAAGRTTQLSPTVYDANGKPVSGATVTWTSSNPALATVSSTGVVQGVAVGTVTITAASGTRKGATTVTVTPVPVASVQLSTPSATVKVGEYVTITATPMDDQGKPLTDRVLSWSSTGAVKLFPVTGGVKLLATWGGPATVTATSAEGVKSTATVTVSNGCACTLVVSPTTLGYVPVGTTVSLTAYAKATADGSVLPFGKMISFRSSDTTVLRQTMKPTTDYMATVTFVGAALGRVTVAASFADQYATPVPATVTGSIARVSVMPSLTTVEVRKTALMNAYTFDSAGTKLPASTVAWSSSDPAVFVVSATGTVTGANPGAGTLTAKASNGVEGYAAVTVVPASVASVTVTPGSTQTGTGSTLALTATLKDAAGNVLTGREVRWTTSSSAIASVDQLGIVTAGTVGNATITATTLDGKSGTATVSVAAPSSPPDTTTAVAVEVYW